MAFETIRLDIADGIATLVLNRPDSMNSLNNALKRELGEALDQLESGGAARVLVITGAGEKAFCAGADIKERSGTDPTPPEFIAAQRRTHALFSRIEALPLPVIAALNGAALGGGFEIALCCDMRIAADHARLGLPEVNLGVIPAGGGTQRLSRLLGPARAKRLIMTAATLNAPEALAQGLIDEVVPRAELAGHVAALAANLAAKPPLALRFAKMAIDRGAEADMQTALEIELYAASLLFASEDRKEGMRAFIEKRKPQFMGK